MVAPIDAKWADNSISDDNLNKTTYGQGTAFPSTWPTDRVFWRTDTNILYKNTGTEGTPVWTEIGGAGLSIINQATYPTYDASKLHRNTSTLQIHRAKDIPKRWVRFSDDNTAYLTDDLTTYSTQAIADLAWPTTDTGRDRVNITNDNIDFNHNINSVNVAINHDLLPNTTNLYTSNTAWILRFKLRFSALTQAGNAVFNVVISDADKSSASSAAQDVIGMRLINDASPGTYGSVDSDNASYVMVAENPVSITWATATDYFFEIVRLTATTYIVRRYTDSTYASVADSSSGTCASTTQNLRYIKIQNQTDINAGVLTGTIDDVIFANGVTSL